MLADNVQTVAHLHGAMAIMQQEHLVTRERLNEEFFSDVVDRAVHAGELDAELGKDTSFDSFPLMSEDEYQQIINRTLLRGRGVVCIHDIDVPAAVPTPTPAVACDSPSRKSMFVTEMGLGKPRVVQAAVDEAPQPLNDFHEHVLAEQPRPVIGGCIPSVVWSDLDSIITYLGIFKELAARVPDTKLDKPAYTQAQIEAELDAERDSQTFKVIVTKLRKRLFADGQLDLDVTRRLNEAGYMVSYVQALGKLTVEITPNDKLAWDV